MIFLGSLMRFLRINGFKDVQETDYQDIGLGKGVFGTDPKSDNTSMEFLESQSPADVLRRIDEARQKSNSRKKR